MKFENYVCYKDKYDKIQSLGVEINSMLLNDDRTLNNSTNMIGAGKDSTKKLFRANLGVPLSLLLIQEEAEKLSDVINDYSNTKKSDKRTNKKNKTIVGDKITCVSNNLFDHLIDLQRNSKKNKKQSRKKKLKKKKRPTRKNMSYF